MPKKDVKYFEVRTPGDGEFDYFVHYPMENYEENYDPTNEESARTYAKELSGGYVAEVSSRKLQ